jgi:pSer/pThr/pTyr-binding forkhead associated (FHA) protein
MSKKISVIVKEGNGANFKVIKSVTKALDEKVTIGRSHSADIFFNFPTLSRDQGIIFSEKGVLMYKDTSSYGTTIIHLNKSKEFVHNKKVIFNLGDAILFSVENQSESILIEAYIS